MSKRPERNERGHGSDYASSPVGVEFEPQAPADGTRYGADFVVDLLQAHGIEYVSLNPGASFRGLHDSLVNYGRGDPEMVLCQHEETAIGMAHGYAKAHSPARPMATILHDVVGLLNASMATYISYIDRTPIMILGGTGPMNQAKRRPRVDWLHTANLQGNAVRDFVKWDDQPVAVEGFSDSFRRGYRVAMTEPQGPVYICYDAQLQEDPVSESVPNPGRHVTLLPSAMGPDPNALDHVANLLFDADRPVIVTQYLGRDHAAATALRGLAEILAIPVVDIPTRNNFPTNHELNLTGSDILSEADLILALDVKHLDLAEYRVLDSATRERVSITRPDAKWAEIGFSDLEISSWSSDYAEYRDMDVSVLADTSVAVPLLKGLIEDRLSGNDEKREALEERRHELASRHRSLRNAWAQAARADWDAAPMTTGRLALEVLDALQEEDWVIASGNLEGQVRKLWPIDEPHKFVGDRLGPGTQIGISLGVALAHKGSGRIVVDFQPDGDLMYDAGALWVAAKHEIPMLVVMFNNRAYYNDWQHQVAIARRRGTPVERSSIGQDLFGPAPDFAELARSMGCHGEGPIEDPTDLRLALRRAIKEVKNGRLALVDAVTRFR